MHQGWWNSSGERESRVLKVDPAHVVHDGDDEEDGDDGGDGNHLKPPGLSLAFLGADTRWTPMVRPSSNWWVSLT